MNHISNQHPNYRNDMRVLESAEECASETGSNQSGMSNGSLLHLVDNKSMNIFRWIEWLVMDELPLSFVSKPLTRLNTKLQHISINTIKKYIFRLSEAVERKITTIANSVPHFNLVFDGWSEDSVHFIGLFIVFPSKIGTAPSLQLLAFAPLLNELNMNAANHRARVESTFLLPSLCLTNTLIQIQLSILSTI
jgi:hypothetical protein